MSDCANSKPLLIVTKSRLTCRSRLLSIQFRCPTDCELVPTVSCWFLCFLVYGPIISPTQPVTFSWLNDV